MQNVIDDVAAVGALGTAVGLGLRSLARSPVVRFARMSGLSIAAPGAAAWVTDFLNAAYYQRPPDERAVDDLRLAYAILATRWQRAGYRRLRAADVVPFHRAFGRDRFVDDAGSARGTLNREQLLEGAARLHGDWFPSGYADDARRAWGIAFPSLEERDAYDPAARLRAGALHALTPPIVPLARQTWHTYDPVAVPRPDALLRLVARSETWPDYASELGRFCPVRRGGLLGQTFEIDIVARIVPVAPLSTRGYVTVTRLADGSDERALRAYVEEANESLARYGKGEPPAVPPGATPLLGLDLTTHAGHFLGRAVSKLLVYQQDGQGYLREVGVWDPMPWHIRRAYQAAGADAQRAFWGMGRADESMLHQMAVRCR